MSIRPNRPHRKVRRQRPAMNSGIHSPVRQAVSRTSSNRTKDSRGRPGDLTCRESETGPDILDREFRKVCQNLVNTHSTGQIFRHVSHGDAHAANARLPAAIARFDGDEITVFLGKNLRIKGPAVNIRRQCVSASVRPPNATGPRKSFNRCGPEVFGCHDDFMHHASARFNCFIKF